MVGLSTDGTRLLACMPSEFACNPVAIDLPGGRQYAFPGLARLGTSQEVSWTLDLTGDGPRASGVKAPLCSARPPDTSGQ